MPERSAVRSASHVRMSFETERTILERDFLQQLLNRADKKEFMAFFAQEISICVLRTTF